MSSLFTHKYTQMMIIKFILIYEDNITNVLQQINRHNFSDRIKVRSFWKLRNRDKIVGDADKERFFKIPAAVLIR